MAASVFQLSLTFQFQLLRVDVMPQPPSDLESRCPASAFGKRRLRLLLILPQPPQLCLLVVPQAGIPSAGIPGSQPPLDLAVKLHTSFITRCINGTNNL